MSISEPDAGSAATDLQTTARRDGDHYIVEGMKRWCSGAGHAEQYLVYVRLTDEPGSRGIGALVVDKETPGLRFGPQEELHGFRGIGSADIFFDEALVPAENLIVEAGGSSLGSSPGHIASGFRMAAHSGQHDPVEGGVGVTVASPVQPITGDLA